MNKTRYILLVVLLSLPVWAAEPEPQPQPVMEEGYVLDGVVGVIRKVDAVDVWHFVPEAEILTLDHRWPAGRPISLLPCSVLEQVTGLAGEDHEIKVRLWGMFTHYLDHNYLYSIYFLPLREPTGAEAESAEPQPETPTANEAAGTEGQPAKDTAGVDEPEPIIPLDILEKIRTNETPDLERFQQVAVVTGDENLIGRTGYLQQTGKVKYFQPNAFGRNVDRHRYLLLPSLATEEAEKQMRKSPGRQRYKISGLVTQYKGRDYILLRRAVRTFTHGNFTD